MRILVVDDELFVLRNTVQIIKQAMPYAEMISFSSPAEVFHYVEQEENAKNPIDIAFLDIELPGMNGIEIRLPQSHWL